VDFGLHSLAASHCDRVNWFFGGGSWQIGRKSRDGLVGL
jgi:hypothetical protein